MPGRLKVKFERELSNIGWYACQSAHRGIEIGDEGMEKIVLMDMETLQWGIRCLSVIVAAGTFALLMIMAVCWQPGKLLLSAYETFCLNLKQGRGGFLDYGKLDDYLRRNGAAVHFGAWMNPVSFTALRLVLASLGLFVGVGFGTAWGVCAAVVLFWLPSLLLAWMNVRDNERMLPELKLVYHAISMQIRAGVYVTDALAECYASVREPRFRKALLSLSGDIAMKADVEEALERFQGQFDNRYVDALCITLLQALESGQAVELLSDLAEQLKDLETALMERKKGSLDRSITFYQLGILAAILAVVLYACISHMFSAVIAF